MKKKHRKQLKDMMATAAFLLQAATFGIQVYDRWKPAPAASKQNGKKEK